MRKYLYLAVLIATVQLFFSASAVAQTVTGWQLTGNRNADTLSFVGTTNGVPLRFATKNAARMVIDTLGNVGVGITKPKYPLDIAGKLRLADGTQGAGKVLTSDANGLTSWLTPASNPWTISGNNLYNINTGNIGIGMTTPAYKLDVSADSRINGVRFGKGRNSFTDNTATGANALDSITTGTGNTANGYYALNFNSTGSKNTAVGAIALSKNTTGSENTAAGAGALQKNTTGKQNAATGAGALNSNTTGSYNVANGDSTLFSNTTAVGNNAVGFKALGNNVTGNYNTALGHQALQYIKSGTYNTAIGYLAGSSGIDSAILTNATAIGANAKVTTNNSLVLGSNANVGIGTTAPTAKLHVAGQIKMVDGNQAIDRVMTSDANGLAKWKIAPGSLWTSVGNDSYLTLPGTLGVGTTSSPYAKVEINKTLKFTNTSADNNDGIIGTAPFADGLNIVGINTTGNDRKINYWGSLIQNENPVGNTFMGDNKFPAGIWNSSGNVGLGTTDLRQRLTVNGNIEFNNATLPKSFLDEVGGTSPLFTMSSNFHEATKNNVYRGGAYRIDLRDGVALHQWYGRLPNSGSENLMMALSENAGLGIGTTFAGGFAPPDNGAIIQGNVGIGKTAPGWKLDVAGDIMADGGYVRVTGNAGLYFQDWGGGWNMSDATWVRTYNEKSVWTGGGLLGSQAGLTVGYGGAAPSGGGASIKGYTQLNGGATINGGYVSICNSVDNTQGNIAIGGGAYGNVKVNINSNQTWGLLVETGAAGKPGGGSWSGISDKRLKKDIKTYSDGLTALLKIKPVTYHYNELSGFNMDKEYVGVIAQDLQEIAPYMVSSGEYKNTGKEFLSVDNSAMTYMLINAVKELKGQTDAKDETITKQQADIKTLQTQMALLLQKIDAIDARQEACCTAANSKNMAAAEQSTSLSSASLEQNVPNPPANNATHIGYNIPKGTGKAQLIIADNYGRKIKEVNLSIMGKGTVNVDTKGLAPGTYAYTLLVDGKMIDTKQMVVGN